VPLPSSWGLARLKFFGYDITFQTQVTWIDAPTRPRLRGSGAPSRPRLPGFGGLARPKFLGFDSPNNNKNNNIRLV